MSRAGGRYLKLFTLCIFIAVLSCKEEKPRHRKETNRSLDSLSQVLQEERTVIDSLKRVIKEGSSGRDSHLVLFGRKFSHIKNPRKYITNSLRQNKEKIPLEGVLGGTMEFRKIEILTNKWIFAIYDDGHIQGTSIYEYEIHPNDSISFSIIATDLP